MQSLLASGFVYRWRRTLGGWHGVAANNMTRLDHAASAARAATCSVLCSLDRQLQIALSTTDDIKGTLRSIELRVNMALCNCLGVRVAQNV